MTKYKKKFFDLKRIKKKIIIELFHKVHAGAI